MKTDLPVRIRSPWRGSAAFVLLLALGATASAHHSPDEVAGALTTEMERHGVTAERLWQRATEYRVLGRHEAAARDLTNALARQPDFLPASADLARAQLALGRADDARRTVEAALLRARDDAGQARLHLLRAEILEAQGRPGAALKDCERAFRLTGMEIDDYLFRAQLQRRHQRFVEAAAGLKAGLDRHGAAVLEAEWIDALIDAGQPRPALERIQRHLRESRWRSAWLLRRARARLALGSISAAHADLLDVATEASQRLHPPHPDVTLLAERGLARALLGDASSARADLELARRHGAPAWVTWRLEMELASPSGESSASGLAETRRLR